MTELERVARKLDAYAGAAVNVDPPIGTIAVPLSLIVELHRALPKVQTVGLST